MIRAAKKLGSAPADGPLLAACALILPWCLWFILRWTITPIGVIDAWIYRGLGQALPAAHSMFPKFYYTARLFALLPRWALHSFLPQGVAHAAFSFGSLYIFLFAISDFTARLATWRTRFFLVFFAATCPYVLRTQGWGYIDGFIITDFALSLAFLARALQPRYGWPKRALWGALSGACFFSMVSTHPMAVVLGFTLLWYYVCDQFFAARRFGPREMALHGAVFVLGGTLAILAMCMISRVLFGEFYFFLPVIDTVIHVSKTMNLWKTPYYQWLERADWLLLPGLALLGSLALLLGRALRVGLTQFEWFAYSNVAFLLGGMALLEWRGGFWLQFSYYTSYFLPAALFAVAALLGESNARPPRRWTMAGVAILFVLIAVIMQGVQRAFLAALANPPGNLSLPSAPVLNVFKLQCGAGILAVILILLHRFALRNQLPEMRWLFPALCACGVALLGNVSHFAIPAGADVTISRNIAGVTRRIQQELGPVRPLFWYDQKSPLYGQFASVNSAYLFGYSALSPTFPQLAWPERPEWRSVSDSSGEPWRGGEQLVILTAEPEKMTAAVETFHQLGLDLKVSHQIFNAGTTTGYWIIFAKTVDAPLTRIFLPVNLQTTLKQAHLVTSPPNGHAVRQSSGEEGYLAFGPYTHMSAGAYTVQYSIKIEGDHKADNALILDVVADKPGPAILASRIIHGGDLSDPPAFQRFDLTFKTDHSVDGVQFRIHTPGTHMTTLDSITVCPQQPAISP